MKGKRGRDWAQEISMPIPSDAMNSQKTRDAYRRREIEDTVPTASQKRRSNARAMADTKGSMVNKSSLPKPRGV